MPNTSTRLPPLAAADLPVALDVWLGRIEVDSTEWDRLVSGLFFLCEDVARGILQDGDDSGRAREPVDIAHDFLASIRQSGLGPILHRAGLKSAMRRHLTRAADPAAAELWGILSDALRALQSDGRVRRLGEIASTANHNDARWIDAHHPPDSPPGDLHALEEYAETLPFFYPPKSASPDRKRTAKVISPSDARTLAEALLSGANGWVTMRELFAAFRKRFFLLRIEPGEPDATWTSGRVERHPATDSSFLELVRKLAAEVWNWAGANNLQPILCRYTLPKFLRGESVTLDTLGKHSSVHDRQDKILRRLRETTEAQTDGSGIGNGNGVDGWKRQLLLHVTDRLEDFCDDAAGNSGRSLLPEKKHL